MRFVGRTAQMRQLATELDRVSSSGQGTMLSVRGRRQVGKSRLLTELVDACGLPHVFFTAIKGANTAQQLQALRADVFAAERQVPEAATLFASAPVDWRDALGRLRLAADQGPVVVVLDEIPWAIEADATFEGRLQAAWDRHLQHLPVLLVLVGSDLAMMARLVEHGRPLYGRARELVIHPFNPAECASALGRTTSAMTAFDAYLVTGGYPRLVEQLHRHGRVAAYMKHGLADENTDLVVMAQRSLDAEFPPDAQARRVLTAIGGHEIGHSTFSSAVGRLPESGKAAETAVTRALSLLSAAGVVTVETPVGARPSSRLKRYRINDPYLRLWFRFAEPHLASLARGRADLAVSAWAAGWASWRGVAIESVVHDALLRLAPSLPALAGIDEVGSWWNRDHSREVDVVGARRGRVRMIGTIKWRDRRRLRSDEVDELARARGVVPGAASAGLLAVCPPGLGPRATPDVLLDAEDLLAAWPR